MRKHTAPRTPWTLLLSVFLMLAMPIVAQAAPGGMTPDEIERHAREIRAHRAEEAAMKQRNAEGWLLAEFQRTFNQEQYDVQHYDLVMDLNPSNSILTGTNTVTALVTGSAISTLELDLDSGMSVSACTAGGVSANFSHASGLLTVTLDQSYGPGQTVVVSVDYAGNPGGGAFGWDSHGGSPMIWTLSEPYGAREWWPCKDLNTDKAETMDITVTVPDDLLVASNGSLLSDTNNGNGTRTFHWYSSYPIVPYLVSLAIHPYVVSSDWYTPEAGGADMEVRFYVFPSDVGNDGNHALVVPMLEAMVPQFGEYPFVNEKYGHAQFLWGGGMEHQTMTSMGGFWESVIAHELGHQWWGDEITCADFSHIWLNEGFASWSEAIWFESQGGPAAYRQYMDTMAYMGGGTVIVENPYSDNIFDGNLSYDKGAWVVHMLRGVLGDTDFYAGLAEYRNQYAGGAATTEQLRDVLEGVSGIDLDAFMQQWVYGDYFPVYQYSWSAAPGGLDLNVQQIQTNTGLFTMPITIRVTTDQGVSDHVIANSLADTDYFLAVAGNVESVELDPDRWILRQVQTTVSDPSFDAGILLVNGVDWGTYDPEIQNAYEAKAFWGASDIAFWDCFLEPAGGYPSTLPAPLGQGSAVPADVIGDYSTVIWVGNHYNGDLPKWQETPILSYLETGGNVLLMGRRGLSFLDGALADYLGVSFVNDGTLGNCVAVYPGLVDIPFTGSQSWNDVFSMSVGANSTLLFKDTSGFGGERGTGVHAQPPGGGTHRAEGAQFVYLAGRPYRMDHAALRGNVEFILENLFLEPWTVTALPEEGPAAAFKLEGNFPNPFNPKTTIRFSLPETAQAELSVYDVEGRLVRALQAGRLEAGTHAIDWDGRDEAGREAAAGVYLYRLTAGEYEATERMVLLK